MKRVRILLSVALLIGAGLLLVPTLMRYGMTRYMYTVYAEVPKTQVAVVLGASVIRGQPSPVLQKRADAAIALYHMKKVDKILISGDDGGNGLYDEVSPTRKYVIETGGVMEEDVFTDHAGFDTYSSMYRAIHIFRADSMTVVTQDFHLPRALYIARHLGAEAYGLVAEGESASSHSYTREIPASVKAILDLSMSRLPRYLGEQFPLEGSGTTTWF